MKILEPKNTIRGKNLSMGSIAEWIGQRNNSAFEYRTIETTQSEQRNRLGGGAEMNRDTGTYEAKINSSNTHVIGVADKGGS